MSSTRVFGIQCPQCDAKIWSRDIHHMCWCTCGYCYVDGGRAYQRVGFGGETFSEPWPVPEIVEIEIIEEESSTGDKKS